MPPQMEVPGTGGVPDGPIADTISTVTNVWLNSIPFVAIADAGTDPSVRPGDESTDAVGDTVAPVIRNPGETVDSVVTDARNLGPEWLDEVTGVAVVLGVLLAVAWVLRPFITVVGGVVGGDG